MALVNAVLLILPLVRLSADTRYQQRMRRKAASTNFKYLLYPIFVPPNIDPSIFIKHSGATDTTPARES
jgi:hypothetical protein